MNRVFVIKTLSSLLGLTLTIVAVTQQSPLHAEQEHAGSYAQADIQVGLRLYSATCTTCHGPNGDLVPGIDLRAGEFERAPSDPQLMELIKNGIPGTAMPPGQYSDAELTGLVAYLRTMGDLDLTDAALGNVARGQALYNGKGDCASCHRIGQSGSRLGPDLSDVGANRTAALLENALVDPTGSMVPINRPVRVVTQAGALYEGRRVNEDTYTVQLIDQNERLRSLEKSSLREFTVMDESPMPAYGTMFNSQELSDVVAYLLSLRGLEN